MAQVKYKIKVSVPPVIEPVELDPLKRLLKITWDHENADLLKVIKSARKRCEKLTRRHFIDTTVRMNLPMFPGDRWIELPRRPLQSVTSIKYQDTDDAQQTLAVTEYVMDQDDERPRIVLKSDKSWPAVLGGGEPDQVEVLYVCGYGTTILSVPDEILQAVMRAATRLQRLRAPGPVKIHADMVDKTAMEMLGQYLPGEVIA